MPAGDDYLIIHLLAEYVEMSRRFYAAKAVAHGKLIEQIFLLVSEKFAVSYRFYRYIGSFCELAPLAFRDFIRRAHERGYAEAEYSKYEKQAENESPYSGGFFHGRLSPA